MERVGLIFLSLTLMQISNNPLLPIRLKTSASEGRIRLRQLLLTISEQKYIQQKCFLQLSVNKVRILPLLLIAQPSVIGDFTVPHADIFTVAT